MIEPVLFMNLCMICDGDRVLVLDRTKEDWKGITFPGGKVEAAEPFADAVIREVREETGLTITAPQLCGISNWWDNEKRSVVFLYKATAFSGKLQASAEGAVWWESLDNLQNLNLCSGMTEYLKIFMQNDLSELYFRNENGSWLMELK